MTSHGPGTNEFWYSQLQNQIDRRFTDLEKDLERRFSDVNRRFTTVDTDIKDVAKKVDKLEDAPKDNFRTYVTPILVSLITAIVLAFLVSRGVAVK